MAQIAVCGGCDSRWTDPRRAHCSGCHTTFGGVTAFDKHRLAYKCQEPASRGLHVNEEGVWSLPAPVFEKENAA